MSTETSQWLNTWTLIGYTDKRGNAWHHRAEHQGEESNSYPGAIPVADVHRRLFAWTAEEAPAFARVPATFDDFTGVDDNGRPFKMVSVPLKHIVRSDTGAYLGTGGLKYTRHQFGEWLMGGVAHILDDDVQVGSAGLLKGGAVAWVSIETPDTITTPEGVAFRPHMLAVSSHDGSLATSYQFVATNTVCDNTMSAALREKGPKYRVKHTANSAVRKMVARTALGIIDTIADDFAAEVKELCETTVTPIQWARFMEEFAGWTKDGKRAKLEGRSKTMADNKMAEMSKLWRHDNRVAPWAGNAWGVVQAVNTYVHHVGIVRGTERAERNMLRAVSGDVDKLDKGTLTMLQGILANA